jgi:hypothetical protein
MTTPVPGPGHVLAVPDAARAGLTPDDPPRPAPPQSRIRHQPHPRKEPAMPATWPPADPEPDSQPIPYTLTVKAETLLGAAETGTPDGPEPEAGT